MDRNGFKVGIRTKNMGLFGLVLALTLLFLSSSAQGLEVTTEDGRDEYEQGEIIIFRISGMNNTTVYLNFVHIVTTKIGNNTTYQKDWYGLNPIILNETGKGSLFHSLDYQTVYGNQEATYGDWDFEVFESVNETTIEFLSYTFKVEVNWDLVLREWDEKHEEDKKETKALIAGLDARDNFKNWVIVALAFLFMMNIATHHLGENPVLLALKKFGILLIKVFSTVEQGEHTIDSHTDERTREETEWQDKDVLNAKAMKSRGKANRLRKRSVRIVQNAKTRAERIENVATQQEELSEQYQSAADEIDVPTLNRLNETLNPTGNEEPAPPPLED